MTATFRSIDGLEMPVRTPASIDELAALVRECASTATPMYPVGGGTGLDFGRPPARPGIIIDLGRLNRVVDYPFDDLTITVEAGLTVRALTERLTQHRQRVPIDVPEMDRATLGGAIAVNAVGPRRWGYGAWRDWIIGMTVVNDQGEVCKSGGRVVKNVAGYDLGKLYAGSLGCLAILAQVTLKLQPMPEVIQWLRIADVRASDLGPLLDQVAASATQPRAVEVVKTGGQFDVLILFEDNAASVAWQIEQLGREVSSYRLEQLPADFEVSVREQSVVAGQPLQLIATLRGSQVGAFLRSPLLQDCAVQAHAMNGMVRLGRPLGTLDDVRRWVKSVTDAVSGNVIVRRCPLEWKTELPIWGRTPSADNLMTRIKNHFDPHNILNPGRMRL